MFSNRTSWSSVPNALTVALQQRRQKSLPVLDLTQSNPTTALPPMPWSAIQEAMVRPENATYVPDSLGLLSARQAVAWHHSNRVSPERVLLTASTSEAYAFLFKLLCDPGSEILVPTPSYPLFDYLAGLESVRSRQYPSHFVDGRWVIDYQVLIDTWTPACRAVLIVTPNNPTGAAVSRQDTDFLSKFCAERQIALISDEVFADTIVLGAGPECFDNIGFTGEHRCLNFVLSGLSKVMLLPQLKCAWVLCQGPPAMARAAMERLEIIADTYLSVATPVQNALPTLLQMVPEVQAVLKQRLDANSLIIKEELSDSAVRMWPAQGGWSTLVRVPAVLDHDDEFALQLLEIDGILVQPGHYFDMPGQGWLVVSRLGPPAELRQGMRKLVQRVQQLVGA